MGTRTTPAEIDGMWRRAVNAANMCGIDTGAWVLWPASTGGSWSLRSRDPRTGGLGDPIGGGGWLGNTRRQALDTLWSLARAWETCADVQREMNRRTYGTLTDYITGEEIRPATAYELAQSLAADETGAFSLDDGRTVFVASGGERAVSS